MAQDQVTYSGLTPNIGLMPFNFRIPVGIRSPVGQVLIVEDDTSTLQLIKAAIREAYELIRMITFSSADDAIWYLEYLKRNRQPGPDLAVVDIFLKGERDGFSICKSIAQDFPETTIVVASSMHPETFKERSQALPNVPNFFSKPFKLRELVKYFRNFRNQSP